MRISVTTAHQKFGDLARIRNGITHWIEVVNPEGRWVPVFDGFVLIAYELMPRESRHPQGQD